MSDKERFAAWWRSRGAYPDWFIERRWFEHLARIAALAKPKPKGD